MHLASTQNLRLTDYIHDTLPNNNVKNKINKNPNKKIHKPQKGTKLNTSHDLVQQKLQIKPSLKIYIN